jgi:hypothetical protein
MDRVTSDEEATGFTATDLGATDLGATDLDAAGSAVPVVAGAAGRLRTT